MFFFKHHIVQLQVVVLVISWLLLAGCTTTLPVSPEDDIPAPAETTAQAVTRSDVRPAQPAGVMPEQLQDLSAVAEYQSRLSGGELVEVVPDQIPDRQALGRRIWLSVASADHRLRLLWTCSKHEPKNKQIAEQILVVRFLERFWLRWWCA